MFHKNSKQEIFVEYTTYSNSIQESKSEIKVITNTQATCFNETPQLSEVSDRLCHPPSVDFSNTTWAQRELINKLAGNVSGSYGTKATINYRD